MPSNEHPGEIRISEVILYKLGLTLLGMAAVFILIGAFISPRDEQGDPIVLSPDVKAMQDYRSSAREWMNQYSALDSAISQITSQDAQGDLFSQSRSAQNTLQNAVDLAQQIDRTSVPPIAVGVQEQISSTALAYVEAARSALQWISAPKQENHDQALQKLEAARQSKNDLEANSWLTSP